MVQHETLALSVMAIGVVLVSYQGDRGTWGHRLFRRDLHVASADPVRDTLDWLNQRRRRTGFDAEDRRDTLSELGRRGFMAYAERAILLERSAAAWRMGHGSPAPYELLTGADSRELLTRSLALLGRLIDYVRWVFIPSAPADRALLTIGDALRPLEYAIVDTAHDAMRAIVERGHYGQVYRPTDDPAMLALLEEHGQESAGVPRDCVHLYHLVGRETANPDHPDARPFSLAFDALSPDAVIEILDMNDAQPERFHRAYDAAVEALVHVRWLDRDQRRDWDLLERGCPGITLAMLDDAVRAFMGKADKKKLDDFQPSEARLAPWWAKMKELVERADNIIHARSWGKVKGQVGQLRRAHVR